MKIFKRIIISFFILVALSILIGYIYFDRKFTPEKNYLIVKNESGNIKIKWEDENKSAILLPIHFENDTIKYFIQFDTGSPYTLFYKKAIENIASIKQNNEKGKASFKIGNTEIESENFKIIDYGKKVKNNEPKIIGTLGSDILENRKTIINFKENWLKLNLSETPTLFNGNLFDFNFKKRKIIIPAKLNNENMKFLYDTGTSAYELLTSKENWNQLKLPNSKVTLEKSNSWGRTLTTFTTNTISKIDFGSTKIPLNQITYVEGYSKTQYYLMKFSGMSGGMLGNKTFLNNAIFIDCKELKMCIY
ncbi:hypothetical protein GOQ30_00055 [Flavobacterium sp. TP390]|uniref:Peptidase A2 domain-containing protein n=1 Tax=Flavobacterium profundi TaxID=1774945 RepID=A0A6I4II70_9FLAO|nr:hypothetical protein [Flavobacterium profundi]MVO07549.1 hypothetical protein [Flavobacterium profundi]